MQTHPEPTTAQLMEQMERLSACQSSIASATNSFRELVGHLNQATNILERWSTHPGLCIMMTSLRTLELELNATAQEIKVNADGTKQAILQRTTTAPEAAAEQVPELADEDEAEAAPACVDGSCALN